jgi:cytochrome c oxidase cbb3-type subunit 2
VYIREGCWYCHSQYVRPVTGEDQRWGPISQSGEYAFDVPHLFSTRRIGPDLTRVGLKYGDDWHYAHHWDPRLVVPDSNMPAFPWLFQQVKAQVTQDESGMPALVENPELGNLFNYESEKEILLLPNPDGLVFARETDGKPVLAADLLPEPFAKHSVSIVIPVVELRGLVAYIQRLGMNRGQWRDRFEPQRVFVTELSIPASPEWIEAGREVYMRRCVGCHGEKGDGNGPAATFMDPRPRNFQDATFKFRVTPSGSLPTDGDLFRTIIRGVRGTAMPSWHEIAEKDRWAVIQFIKTFSPYFEEERPEPPVYIPEPPPPSEELVARGQEVYVNKAKCWECHGGPGMKEGEPFTYPWGEGPSAADLKDDWRFPIPATDFTSGIFKSGPDVTDVFRTMTTGLNGTPMPSYKDTLTEEERWTISYFMLSLSAYTDTLHARKLDIPEEVKVALDSPELKTPSWRTAFQPSEAKLILAKPKSRSYLGIVE